MAGARANAPITTILGNLGDPTLGQDAATKTYVDRISGGVSVVTGVTYTATSFTVANATAAGASTVTLSAAPSFAAGTIISFSNASQSSLYVVSSSAGAVVTLSNELLEALPAAAIVYTAVPTYAGATALAPGKGIIFNDAGTLIQIETAASSYADWFSGSGAPTTIATAVTGNFYWDTVAGAAYVCTNTAPQTWKAEPNLDAYVRSLADTEIANKVGSVVAATPYAAAGRADWLKNTGTSASIVLTGSINYGPAKAVFANLGVTFSGTSGFATLPTLGQIYIAQDSNPGTNYIAITQISFNDTSSILGASGTFTGSLNFAQNIEVFATNSSFVFRPEPNKTIQTIALTSQRAGTGIAITPDSGGTFQTFNNTGVLSTQGIVGAVGLVSPDNSVSISTTGQNISLTTNNSGISGAISVDNFGQVDPSRISVYSTPPTIPARGWIIDVGFLVQQDSGQDSDAGWADNSLPYFRTDGTLVAGGAGITGTTIIGVPPGSWNSLSTQTSAHASYVASQYQTWINSQSDALQTTVTAVNIVTPNIIVVRLTTAAPTTEPVQSDNVIQNTFALRNAAYQRNAISSCEPGSVYGDYVYQRATTGSSTSIARLITALSSRTATPKGIGAPAVVAVNGDALTYNATHIDSVYSDLAVGRMRHTVAWSGTTNAAGTQASLAPKIYFYRQGGNSSDVTAAFPGFTNGAVNASAPFAQTIPAQNVGRRYCSLPAAPIITNAANSALVTDPIYGAVQAATLTLNSVSGLFAGQNITIGNTPSTTGEVVIDCTNFIPPTSGQVEVILESRSTSPKWPNSITLSIITSPSFTPTDFAQDWVAIINTQATLTSNWNISRSGTVVTLTEKVPSGAFNAGDLFFVTDLPNPGTVTSSSQRIPVNFGAASAVGTWLINSVNSTNNTIQIYFWGGPDPVYPFSNPSSSIFWNPNAYSITPLIPWTEGDIPANTTAGAWSWVQYETSAFTANIASPLYQPTGFITPPSSSMFRYAIEITPSYSSINYLPNLGAGVQTYYLDVASTYSNYENQQNIYLLGSGSSAPPLNEVLVSGNSTSGRDIIVSAGDSLVTTAATGINTAASHLTVSDGTQGQVLVKGTGTNVAWGSFPSTAVNATSPNSTIAIGGTGTNTLTFDIASGGATVGQGLIWNGTKYAPGNVTAYYANQTTSTIAGATIAVASPASNNVIVVNSSSTTVSPIANNSVIQIGGNVGTNKAAYVVLNSVRYGTGTDTRWAVTISPGLAATAAVGNGTYLVTDTSTAIPRIVAGTGTSMGVQSGTGDLVVSSAGLAQTIAVNNSVPAGSSIAYANITGLTIGDGADGQVMFKNPDATLSWQYPLNFCTTTATRNFAVGIYSVTGVLGGGVLVLQTTNATSTPAISAGDYLSFGNVSSYNQGIYRVISYQPSGTLPALVWLVTLDRSPNDAPTGSYVYKRSIVRDETPNLFLSNNLTLQPYQSILNAKQLDVAATIVPSTGTQTIQGNLAVTNGTLDVSGTAGVTARSADGTTTTVGTTGQLLVSQGANNPPRWATPTTSLKYDMSNSTVTTPGTNAVIPLFFTGLPTGWSTDSAGLIVNNTGVDKVVTLAGKFQWRVVITPGQTITEVDVYTAVLNSSGGAIARPWQATNSNTISATVNLSQGFSPWWSFSNTVTVPNGGKIGLYGYFAGGANCSMQIGGTYSGSFGTVSEMYFTIHP